MASVIDHIVVELGLDPKKFDESVKKSAEAWMKMRQQAQDAHKNTEEPVNNIGKAFSFVTTKVLAFFAAFVTVKKMVDFGATIVKTTIDLRNLARTTGISIESLSKLAGVADRSGSSMQSMATAIDGIDRDLKSIQVGDGGGKLAALVNTMNKQFGAGINVTAQTNAYEVLIKLVEAMDKAGLSDAAKNALWIELGYVDRSFVQLLTKGHDNLRKMIDAQKDIYVITEKNVDVAQQLLEKWTELEQRFKSLGTTVLHDLSDPLLRAIGVGNETLKTGKVPQHGHETGHETFETMARPDERPKGWQSIAPKAYVPPGWFTKGRDIPLPPSRPDEVDIPSKATPNSFSRDSAGQTFHGAASYYTGLPSEGGNRTSTGEMVRPDTYSGAMQSDLAKQYGGLRKGGVWADVIDQASGKRVRVYLNDTGPLRPGRMVDLSPKAFQEFAPLSKGVVPNLRMEILPKGGDYKGGPVQDDPFGHGAPPIPWLSNPRLLRAPRFNQMLNPTQNYSTAEMNVHSMIFNSPEKRVTDDAYGLSSEAIPTLDRGGYMTQNTEGPF